MFDNFRMRLNFDDLLFKTRNRDYGAYQLRKRYNSVVLGSIIIASVLISTVVILPFILTKKSDRVLGRGIGYVQVQMDNFKPPVDQIIVPPPPPPPEAARALEEVKYIPPVVVDTVLPMENTQISTDVFLARSTENQVETGGVGTGDDLLSGQEGTETGEPFFLVEVMPAFKGGDINKFREWVQRRTNYPQAAIDKKIQGKVFITFIIETDGTVSNVTIVKGVDPIIDIEAVKAIESSPRWSPGLQRGKPVRVRYSMMVNFVY